MKSKKTVGLLGNLRGLNRKLNVDLPELGFVPFEIDSGDLAHPPGTVAVICGTENLESISRLIESLQDDHVQLVFVSMAKTNHPETQLADIGRLDFQAETLIRESGLTYTIVRAMGGDARPGNHRKIFWKQDLGGDQNGQQNPVPWEDLAQVLVHCVNRSQAISKTFTVHAVAGEPPIDSSRVSTEYWDRWFHGLSADSPVPTSRRKSA